MNTAVSVESILELLKDDSKFSAKIEELTEGTRRAEQACKDAIAAQSQLDKKKIETDNYVNGRKAELNAKQLEHDKAAKEAADRIEVGRNQMAEVQRIQAEVNAKQSELDGRERNLIQREKLLKDAQASLAARLHEIEVGQDLVRRQQAHIAAMPRQ